MRLGLLLLACASVGLQSPTVARAQGFAGLGGGGGFSGSGSVEIKRAPQRMRMQVDLLAKGKTLKEALERLKSRRETALSELQKLGAVKESVNVDDPVLHTPENDQSAQVRRMMMARATGKSAAKKPPVQLVTVKSVLKAEWKLIGAEQADRLVSAHDLKEKIEKVDLSGSKEVSKLTPEEQELAEEMEAEGNMYSSGEEKKAGAPTFLYVAPLTEADRDAALAEAYKKARDRAARLAKAAGLELGPLVGLSSSGSQSAIQETASMYGGYSEMYRALLNNDSDDQTEAVGDQPGKVAFRITVQATFKLKGP